MGEQVGSVVANPVKQWRVDEPISGLSEGGQFRVVSTDGEYFQGYVAVAAKALIEAVVADCYPDGAYGMSVTVIALSADDADYQVTYGKLRGFDGEDMVFTDGTRVPLDTLVSVEI